VYIKRAFGVDSKDGPLEELLRRACTQKQRHEVSVGERSNGLHEGDDDVSADGGYEMLLPAQRYMPAADVREKESRQNIDERLGLMPLLL
jgi:hypothetical protein